MIRRFLRPPSGAGEWVADAIRVLGPLSVLAGFVWWAPTDAGVLALALFGLVLPRFVGVRPGFDIAFCVTVLVAAWSNVFLLYQTVLGWDLIVHFVFTGMVAAMAYLLLARLELVPPPLAPGTRRATPILLVTSLGLALSAVWEMLEWIGWRFISEEIYVAYEDSIGDMAAGGLGGLLRRALAGVEQQRREQAQCDQHQEHQAVDELAEAALDRRAVRLTLAHAQAPSIARGGSASIGAPARRRARCSSRWCRSMP